MAPEAVQSEPCPFSSSPGYNAFRQQIIAEIIVVISKPKGVAPPIKTDVSTPLPDFQEYGAAKKIFSQPFRI